MRKLLLFCFLFTYIQSFSQKTENVFLITSDGLRWQDVFSGADSAIIFNKTFTPDSAETVKEFWAKTAEERREKILPFLWRTVARR
jgi:hypothetical protein